MNAKQYLEQYERLYRQAQRLTAKIQELEVLSLGTGAIRYDVERVKSSVNADSMRIVDRKVQLKMVLRDTIDELISLRTDLDGIFSRLVNRDRRIAELTWLNFEGSVYIAYKLGISRRTVFRRRKMILQFVQEILDS